MLYNMSNKQDEEWWAEYIAWSHYTFCCILGRAGYPRNLSCWRTTWAKMAVKPGWNVHTSVLWAW